MLAMQSAYSTVDVEFSSVSGTHILILLNITIPASKLSIKNSLVEFSNPQFSEKSVAV